MRNSELSKSDLVSYGLEPNSELVPVSIQEGLEKIKERVTKYVLSDKVTLKLK